MSEILDTNVLVRFLVGDVPAQKKRAEHWFAEGEKAKRNIVVSTLVVAETAFVLESFYKKSRREIAEALEIFLSQRWLEIPEREVLLSALNVYKQKQHFVDCYLLSWSQTNHSGILTFDKKLKKQVD